MLEDTLKLDYAGIIALPKETETEYIRRGNNVLEKADKAKDDFDLIHMHTDKMPKQRAEFPAEVSESMKKLFGVNPSWLPVYKMEYKWGVLGYCCEVYSEGARIPVIFYHRFFGKGCSTIQHEAVHAVRDFVLYSRFDRFEEEFAYCDITSNFGASRAIRNARQKLEDRFGEKTGHILIRLTPPEVRMIASSKEPVTHLKEWGCLRHRIIRERLGL